MLTHQSSTLAARTECHPAIEPPDTALHSVDPASRAGAIGHVADAKDTQLLQGSIYEHYEIGSNGLGKTMLAKNIAYQALIAGHTVLCTVAGELLVDLTATESDAALRRRLRQYSAPDLLLVDEIGYLAYSNRHADLLFELLNRRYEKKSTTTTIITTNKPFAQWQEVFPSAGCVVSLVDRLVHRSEVIAIEGKSYRLKEAEERSERNQRRRRAPKASK
jgi:DNA replication protein DnaC